MKASSVSENLWLAVQPLGFEALSPMQEAMVAESKRSPNIQLLSPTGSGKTLAYALSLLQYVRKTEWLQAVVIVPTRELAKQADDFFKRLDTPLNSTCFHGGRPLSSENNVFAALKPEVLFTTPGRFLDHLNQGDIEPTSVATLVIDEFDKCLELGFSEEMSAIVSALPNVRRKWLTSATDIVELPGYVNGKFSRLDFIGADEKQKEKLQLFEVSSPQRDKLETLAKLLSTFDGEQAIVFVAHRESVERVAHYLKSLKFAVEQYHGGMEQELRERALHRFIGKSATVLVSTDLAARGLDIPAVRNIVHYHLPLSEEDFIHRSGRTARWDAGGNVFMILNDADEMPEFIKDVAEKNVDSINIKAARPVMTTIYIGRGKKEKLSKGDIVGFLCKQGGLQSADIGHIDVLPHHSFVTIQTSRVKAMLQKVAGEKIKGMKTLIEPTGK